MNHSLISASGNTHIKIAGLAVVASLVFMAVVSASGVTRTGTFWIAPSAFPLDVARGPVGTTFKVHLKGVGWSETANIYTVVYDNGLSGYACGFNSQGDVGIILQATG